jgi:methylase of polypeptide subunit release factors
VSNPPYIPLHEYRALPASVRSYEDPRALLGDPSGGEGDGLAFYRCIAGLLPDVLQSEEEMNRDGLGGLPRVAVRSRGGRWSRSYEVVRAGWCAVRRCGRISTAAIVRSWAGRALWALMQEPTRT